MTALMLTQDDLEIVVQSRCNRLQQLINLCCSRYDDFFSSGSSLLLESLSLSRDIWKDAFSQIDEIIGAI